MRILIACEYSGIVRDAFIHAGSPENLAMWLEKKGLKKQAKQIIDGINGRLN